MEGSLDGQGTPDTGIAGGRHSDHPSQRPDPWSFDADQGFRRAVCGSIPSHHDDAELADSEQVDQLEPRFRRLAAACNAVFARQSAQLLG